MKGFSLVAALVALQSAFLFSVGRSPSPEQAAARLAAASRRAVAAVSSRDVVVVSAPRDAERVLVAVR